MSDIAPSSKLGRKVSGGTYISKALELRTKFINSDPISLTKLVALRIVRCSERNVLDQRPKKVDKRSEYCSCTSNRRIAGSRTEWQFGWFPSNRDKRVEPACDIWKMKSQFAVKLTAAAASSRQGMTARREFGLIARLSKKLASR